MRESVFICPVCAGKLAYSEDGARLYCPMRHSYDLSAKGYVNLLPPGKRSHGDDREMIAARSAFLDSGAYMRLRDALCSAAAKHPPASLLDVGCGEGYYTQGLQKALPGTRIAGVDLSKDALILAARRLGKEAFLAAGSAYALPVADASFEALTLLFAPLCREECLRVLPKGGRFYLVVPGARHLWGLKSLLYDTPYENEEIDPFLAGFRLEEEQRIEYLCTLQKDALRALFRMTPYFYRTPAGGRKKAEEAESLTTEVSFRLLCYSKE